MTLLIVIIALALIFDYINGFHDAANSIATVVSTKVLTPLQQLNQHPKHQSYQRKVLFARKK